MVTSSTPDAAGVRIGSRQAPDADRVREPPGPFKTVPEKIAALVAGCRRCGRHSRRLAGRSGLPAKGDVIVAVDDSGVADAAQFLDAIGSCRRRRVGPDGEGMRRSLCRAKFFDPP